MLGHARAQMYTHSIDFSTIKHQNRAQNRAQNHAQTDRKHWIGPQNVKGKPSKHRE